MYTQQDFETIKEIVIRDIPIAVSVILFGSYARGTAKEDSDIDIVILLDKEPDWQERHKILNKIYQHTGNKGYRIDFILKTKEKYNNDRYLPTISRVISREGKLLWTKN